jgi:hypothetical protein
MKKGKGMNIGTHGFDTVKYNKIKKRFLLFQRFFIFIVTYERNCNKITCTISILPTSIFATENTEYHGIFFRAFP